jgi:hypothetical protein
MHALAAEIARLKAEVERLKGVIEAVHGIRHDNLIMAQRLAKWRDLCLDEIADLKLSLAVFEQGAVVDAKLIKNLEAERDAAYRAVEAKEEIIKIAERCVEERDEARAERDALASRADRLEERMKRISIQHLREEMDYADDADDADWEAGYTAVVEEAREALREWEEGR